jgi:hypothetical protein
MPIHYNNLFYDYYLINFIIMLLGCISLIGLICSYITGSNSEIIESIVCYLITAGLIGWCLILARINIAVSPDIYTGYITMFMIALTIITIIQMGFLSTYIQFAYTTTLFRILMVFFIILAAATRMYNLDNGIRWVNLLSLSVVVSVIFIVSSMLAFRFRYYLYYKSTHIETDFPKSR